jgi:hypothetical protein
MLVQLSALTGIQQLILFLSSQVDISKYVPILQAGLNGTDLLLRRASASLLRQLAQRQPEVLVKLSVKLDEQLFRMLDIEVSVCSMSFVDISDSKTLLFTGRRQNPI